MVSGKISSQFARLRIIPHKQSGISKFNSLNTCEFCYGHMHDDPKLYRIFTQYDKEPGIEICIKFQALEITGPVCLFVLIIDTSF